MKNESVSTEDKKPESFISEENMKRLTAVRKPDEIDMVSMVATYLEESVSIVAKDLFLGNPGILLVKDSTPGVQRVAINRYFTTKLLVFKASSDIPVMDQLMFLVLDGETKDWLELFRDFVVPFLKEHNIS